MQNIFLIKRSFVRQSSEDNCGLACLNMILNYSGKSRLANALKHFPAKAGGFSLYELQALAYKYGYSARSVEMELSYLRDLKAPCILHTQTEHGHDHYQVCYGSEATGNTYRYLMADPAKQVYYISEKDLLNSWVSKAALFFEDLEKDLDTFRDSPWKALLTLGAFPSGFWVVIPLLTLCSASFGIALTWVLQRGITNSYFLKTHIFIALIILLFLISLFKSLFGFLRQYLLIRLNLAVNQNLMSGFIAYLFNVEMNAEGSKTAFSIRNNLKDMQKIQTAASEILATVLSEGSLILIFTSATVYLYPLSALINWLYLILIGVLTYKGLPENSYYIAHLNHLSATTESFLLQDVDHLGAKAGGQHIENRLRFHEANHALNIDQTRKVAVKASLRSLGIEVLGTLHVIAVFSVSLLQLQSETMDYSTFMLVVILSYMITSVVPKVCNAMAVIADGADASVQYRSVHSRS